VSRASIFVHTVCWRIHCTPVRLPRTGTAWLIFAIMAASGIVTGKEPYNRLTFRRCCNIHCLVSDFHHIRRFVNLCYLSKAGRPLHSRCLLNVGLSIGDTAYQQAHESDTFVISKEGSSTSEHNLNFFVYDVGMRSDRCLSCLSVCLSVCVVAKRLDGSRRH